MSKKKKRKAGETSTESIPAGGKKITATATTKSPMTWWLLLLVLLLPLLYSEQTMDAYVSVRYIFLAVFTAVFIIFFFLGRSQARAFPFPPLVKWILITGLGFAAWSIICMPSALNFHEGYLVTARYLLYIIVLAIVLFTVANEESAPLKICKALLIMAIFQGMVGILQFYDIAFTQLPGANAKPFGMMGNRNLFGSAQALLFPFVLYVFYKGSNSWKYASGIVITILVFSILLSQTRSAWLASAAVIIGSLILVLIFSSVNRKKWLIGTIAIMATTALLVFLVLSVDKEGELSQSIKERAQSFTPGNAKSNESIDNAQERLKIWRKTIQLIKDKPITGAGPGNWRIAIPAYGTEGLAWAYGQYSPDQPHNEYLHVAAETGIPGAVLYYGMWLLVVIAAFRIIIKPASEDERILIILMLTGLAAFATDAMFSFPAQRIEHSLYLTLAAGIILGRYAKKISAAPNLLLKRWIIIASCFVLVFNIFLGYAEYNFEVHMIRAKIFENNNDYQNMLEEAEAGKSNFITLGPDVGTPLQLKTSIAYKELKQLNKALEEINIAKQYHPNSAPVYNTLGTIYTDMGQFDKAIEAYEHGLKIVPHYPVLLKNLTLNYFNVKKYQACINTAMQIPRDADSAYFNKLINDAKNNMALQ